MSDLIERLRGKNAKYGRQVPMSIYTEAADEIELLEAKLTQDPKDARCQLYKATQKWQQEAERCNAEIERLKSVVDAAAWYVNSLENGKTAEAMNLRLQALAKALAALEGEK